MPAAPPSPDQPCAQCGGKADWRAEQLAILRELNDLNMRLARAVVARVEAASEPDAEPIAHTPDPSLALSRLGRAVRLTLAMEAKLRGDQAGAGEAKASRPKTVDDILGDEPRRRAASVGFARMVVADAMEEAVGWPEAHERPDDFDREDLLDDIAERVNALSDDILHDVPIGVLIDRLCAEFNLEPDPKHLGDPEDHHIWRGWELPPHVPEPLGEAEQEEALELSS
jgi:hypothetical protein